MAGGSATLQLLATLQRWPRALQLRAGPRDVAAMADSALDLAACCCDVRQHAGPRSVAAMSDSTTTPANAALQRFCFVFFIFYPTT